MHPHPQADFLADLHVHDTLYLPPIQAMARSIERWVGDVDKIGRSLRHLPSVVLDFAGTERTLAA
jgi:hypothetical protein